MFCPSCGTEERQPSQFCRACGSDMRMVRTAIQQPDSITASAITARDEIGRAIAAKIHQVQDARELKEIAEDVLPEIEKFLESPEERRLRRLRAGTITAAIGLGATFFLLLMSSMTHEKEMPWPAGLVLFFIGVGILVNGLYFTVPKKQVPDFREEGQTQNTLDQMRASVRPVNTAEMLPPASVTENTTEILDKKPVGVPHMRNTR